MFEVGQHLVKICDFGFNEKKEGKTPSLFVEFENSDGERMRWFGYLSEKARPWTMKTLMTMGFTGNWDSFSGGIMDCLNIDKEFSVTVGESEYNHPTTGEIKTSKKIDWINDPEAGPKKADLGQSVSIVKEMNLKAEFAKLEQERNQQKLPLTEKKTVNAEDIPF